MKRLHSSLIALLLILLLIVLCSFSALASERDREMSGNPLVVDMAGLLTESERLELEQRAQSISRAHGCEVIILTVNGTNGKSAEVFADDFFIDNDYGFGPDRNGIMLFLDMRERDYQIETHGSAIRAFPDEELEYLASRFLPDLSDGYYFSAFKSYQIHVKTIIGYYDGTLSMEEKEQYQKDYEQYAGGGKSASKPNYVKKGLLSVLLGGLAGFVPVTAQKSALKTVRKSRGASGYARNGSLMLTSNRDIYLYSNVTCRVIESPSRTDSGGHTMSGGHSTTHTHSSGSTFGGHGGKF